MSKDHKKLGEQSERSTMKMLDARNLLMLEAVVSAFLDVHTPEETAEILRDFATQLEEYR